MSKFAVAMSLYSVERKIEDATYKFFTGAWDQAISRGVVVDETQSVFMRRLFDALLTAFFWGQVDAWAKIGKQERKQFAELEHEHIVAVIKKALKEHPEILLAFARKKVSEDEAIRLIFDVPKESIEFLYQYTVKLANVESEAVLREVTEAVRETIERGMSEADAYKLLNERLRGFKEQRVKAIARTEATRAYNMGLIARSFKTVKGYRYSAVLDSKTTKMCQQRHGKFIPADDIQLLATNTPPLHVNCRSTLVPELTVTGERLDMSRVEPPAKRDVDIADFINLIGRLR